MVFRAMILCAAAGLGLAAGAARAQDQKEAPTEAAPKPAAEAADDLEELTPEVRAIYLELRRAHALVDQGKHRAAGAALDALIAKLEAGNVEGKFSLITRVKLGKAHVSFSQNRIDEAVSQMDEAIARLSADKTEDPLLFVETMTLRLLALSVGEDWPKVEVEAQNQIDLIEASDDAESPDMRRAHVFAVGIQATALLRQGKTEKANAALDAIAKSARESKDPDVLAALIEPVNFSALVLEEEGKYTEALPFYDLAIKLSADGAGDDDDERLARLMTGKGVILEKLGRDADARDAYKATLDRFAGSKAQPVVGQLAKSRYGRAGLFAKTGNVNETITELRGVVALGRTLNVDLIANDANFRPLYRNQQFIAFVRSGGRR
jgi:tetratricopeptide (TPR) repeat protein